MKKIALLFAVLSTFLTYGQGKISQKIEMLNASQTSFARFSPLTVNNSAYSEKAAKAAKRATFATVDKQLIKELSKGTHQYLEIDLPYAGSTVTVQLYKAEILAEGFHVDTDKQKNINYAKGAHYRGIIKGNSASVASFSFFRKEMTGMVSSVELGNLVTGKLHAEGNFDNYIVYSDANLVVPHTFGCATPEPELPLADSMNQLKSTQDVNSANCVTMYFEIDRTIHQQNWSIPELTTNWMTSLFNNVQTLYDNDGITVALKSMYIWTTNDPYSGDSSTDYLQGFFTQRPTFDGDLGQLIGIDEGGLGGLAGTIGGICSDIKHSYADVDFEYQDVPVFSWDVQVITHEFGHLMGSPHTHGCYWNGNNTAIDGCGSSEGFVEGNCPIANIPWTAKGSIMSYCHLVSGVGINFANGFGTQPANRILNHVNGSGCLSTDCVSTCINSVTSYYISDSEPGTITIGWVDNSEGPWEVAYNTLNGTFSNWQLVNSNTFTATGTTDGEYYKFSVRPYCTGTEPPSGLDFVTASGGDYCSAAGYTFTDTGGTVANYPDNQYLVRTFTPSIANTKIKAVFSEFSLEADFDYLSVYDGPDSNAPLLGMYTGETIDETFQSTATDGSLTFVFTSDQFTTEPGWLANISCVAFASVKGNEISDFNYYPNPANDIINISAAEPIEKVTIYNVAGQLLMSKAINSNNSTINIAALAQGVYIFKAQSGDKETNFRVIKN